MAKGSWSLDAWPKDKALYDIVKREAGTGRTLIGFSRGKDAIAAAIAILPHFDEVIPVYFDALPGLDFVAESIDYYERKLFKRKIYVVPHPAFIRLLENHVFQCPTNFSIMAEIPFPRWREEEVLAAVREAEGLSEDVFQATGVRALDNLVRRTAIAKHGPITRSKRKFHAVWDWNKDRLISEIRKSGISLPMDYKIWGRTLDGLGARWLLPLKDYYPEDYRRILDFFPLLEADCIRYARLIENGEAPRGQAI